MGLVVRQLFGGQHVGEVHASRPYPVVAKASLNLFSSSAVMLSNVVVHSYIGLISIVCCGQGNKGVLCTQTSSHPNGFDLFLLNSRIQSLVDSALTLEINS